MHGVIFTSFRDYLSSVHGGTTAADVFTGEPLYLLSEAYDDERLFALVAKTSATTGLDADDIVHDFGVFTGERTFTRLYPAFFAIAPGTRSFLLTVETRIHELVRATIPNAAPPQLAIAGRDGNEVSISYTSPRQLCVLLQGLVEGTARHYGETAAIEEATCMRRGDHACTFHVSFRPLAEGVLQEP